MVWQLGFAPGKQFFAKMVQVLLLLWVSPILTTACTARRSTPVPVFGPNTVLIVHVNRIINKVLNNTQHTNNNCCIAHVSKIFLCDTSTFTHCVHTSTAM